MGWGVEGGGSSIELEKVNEGPPASFLSFFSPNVFCIWIMYQRTGFSSRCQAGIVEGFPSHVGPVGKLSLPLIIS